MCSRGSAHAENDGKGSICVSNLRNGTSLEALPFIVAEERKLGLVRKLGTRHIRASLSLVS